MKKFLSIILVLALVLCVLSSCGNEAGGDGADTGGSETAPVPVASDSEGGEADEFDYSAALEDNGYFKGVRALDYVTLPQYDPMVIPADVHAVSDEDIDAQIESVLSSYAEKEHILDRAVENGDTVNITYVGKVDGVAFEGGSTGENGTEVTIGVTNYIDDFLEQVIGHMPGDNFDIEVTFPDNYDSRPESESLNGKDAVFNTTVNYIVGESIVPELTDEFVETNLKTYYGASTVEEFRKAIADEIRSEAIIKYIEQHIVDDAVFSELPEAVYKYSEDSMIDYYNSYAQYYGMTLDDFIVNVVKEESLEAFLEKSRESNENQAKFMLAIQAVCEDCDKITVDDDLLTEYFEKNMGTSDFSSYIEQYGKGYISMVVMTDTVMEYLQDHVQLAD